MGLCRAVDSPSLPSPQAVADFTAVIELQPSHVGALAARGDLLYGRTHGTSLTGRW